MKFSRFREFESSAGRQLSCKCFVDKWLCSQVLFVLLSLPSPSCWRGGLFENLDMAKRCVASALRRMLFFVILDFPLPLTRLMRSRPWHH